MNHFWKQSVLSGGSYWFFVASISLEKLRNKKNTMLRLYLENEISWIAFSMTQMLS